MKRISWSLLLFLALGLPLAAQDEADPPKLAEAPLVKKSSADDLVGELGSPEFKKREAASGALRGLGKKALLALRKHKDHKDAEIRMRVRSLIDEIEHPLAAAEDQASTPEPKIRKLRPLRRKFNSSKQPQRADHQSQDDYRKTLREWFKLGTPRSPLSSQSLGGIQSSTMLFHKGVQLNWQTNAEGVSLSVKESTPEKKSLRYAARDLEDFKAKHPAIYDRYKASGIFEQNAVKFDVFGPGRGGILRQGKRQDDLIKRLETLLKRSLGNLDRPDLQIQFGDPKELNRELRKLLDLGKNPLWNDIFGDLDRRRRVPRATRKRLIPDGPKLGVFVSQLPAEVALQFDAAKTGVEGLYVAEVDRASLADRAGLKTGDILMRFNGRPLSRTQDLIDAFSAAPFDANLSVWVWRSGATKLLKLTKPSPPKPKIVKKPATPEAPKKLQKIKKF